MGLPAWVGPSVSSTETENPRMLKSTLTAAVFALVLTGSAMAQERIRISSDWGEVTAELADNAAARELSAMLPLTIEMIDHLRQEKTGSLPSPLPEIARQRDFSIGTLGLWSSDHFVIYSATAAFHCPESSSWDRSRAMCRSSIGRTTSRWR